MLYTASINSGSNGNCYYVGNDHEAVFIDAGVSCRETEKRMRTLGLSLHKIKAVFISHEHIDHIKGVERLSAKYQLPVYITPRTHQNSHLSIQTHLLKGFATNDKVIIGSLTITAFTKAHDAADPCSFMVSGSNVNVGIFTDIGVPCDKLGLHFGQCHAAFLEANYDAQMLETGRYPYHLKNRIRGGNGHLSNDQALDVFRQHKPEFMSHLFLAHLSQDNNCPEKAKALFNDHAGNTRVCIASRHHASEVFTIYDHQQTPVIRPVERFTSIQQSLPF